MDRAVHGFERVIEPEMTESPYRFKPVDIYYHTYIASKNASLESLKKVYRAQDKPLFCYPVRAQGSGSTRWHPRKATLASQVAVNYGPCATGGSAAGYEWR